ncbi:hypothetical protein GCM10025864_17170 [Luteimicrobium album]|uniref:DUF4097 domain-containing protein n=1 Tax=Luteimicrobium album TaxID=1054550 RepID=A0ABQ6I1B7_9MICO|nr:DUF4097 family beta strand repeat-containing protein [Luteimicrobium album]GMA23958.1 hypothetical protein GCM10025864_17170 [Luteimicrobium album]
MTVQTSTPAPQQFPTPGPVVLDAELAWARLDVVASERDDTVVTVTPHRPDRSGDARLASETTVELADGVLRIRTPRSWRFNPLGPSKDSVDVLVELPEGSELRGRLAAGNLVTRGALGAVTFRTSAGDLRVDEAGPLELQSSAGAITVGRATGAVTLTAAVGAVRVREIAGDATVKCHNGSTIVGEITGTLAVRSAHADVTVENARGDVEIKGSYGQTVVERIDRGQVRVESGYGSIDIGVPEGVAAWLDLGSTSGSVRSELEPSSAPSADDADSPTVEIHAQTSWGDVTVRRPRP